jgi:FkbM family methyltransferase
MVRPIVILTFLKRHSIHWILKGLRAVGLRTVKHRLSCGYLMIIGTTDLVGERLLLEQTFEPAVRREFERNASRNVNIVDIGANIGYYSLVGASLISKDRRIFAFEPQPRVIPKLRRNINQNGLENVVILPFALSENRGVAQFYVPVDGVEGHGSLHKNGRFEVRETVDVETRRLDDVISEIGNPVIGLMKIDAEGAELSILRGATRLLQGTNRPVLIFEANEENCKPFGCSVFDLLQYIRSFGYQLTQLDSEDWIAEPELGSQ